MDNEPKIRLQHLSKVYGHHSRRVLARLAAGAGRDALRAEGTLVAVDDVSLDIAAGEIFVIMGLSGSGKSTLLRLINRLQQPTRGSVFVDGENVTRMGGWALRRLRRRKFGMVFQNVALLPQRSVLENVEFGLEILGEKRDARRRVARQVLETVGLAGCESMYAGSLSGGMQQRVGLARALAVDPEILLMDEAFSSLDPITRNQLQDDLLEIQDRLGKTIVFVSHDLDEAIKLGSRIAILRDGRLVQVGTPQEILAHPADDYVAAFVEGADRTRVLSAADIMQPLRVAAHPKDAPRALLRKMEHSGFGGLIALDLARRLLGYVDLAAASAQRDCAQIDPATLRSLPSAPGSAKLAELIRIVNAEGSPLAIVDARSRVVGVVDKSTLLAALARSEPQRAEGA
jgi:glycine betaine/proline transport system ATP-binding protein